MKAPAGPAFTLFKPKGSDEWWARTTLPTGTKKEGTLGTKNKDAAGEIAKMRVRQWHSVSKAGQARWKGERRKDGSPIQLRGAKAPPTVEKRDAAKAAAADEQREKAIALIGQWSHPPDAERPTPPTPHPVVPPAPASSPPPPPPAAAPPPASSPPPRDADWAADVGAAAGGPKPGADDAAEPQPTDEELAMFRMMLEQLCSGLVEGQLLLQAWIIKRRTGKEAPIPIDAPMVNPITKQEIPSFRMMAAKYWAIQIERWFPNLMLPPWAAALLLTSCYMPWQFAKAEKKPDAAAGVDDVGAPAAARTTEDARQAA